MKKILLALLTFLTISCAVNTSDNGKSGHKTAEKTETESDNIIPIKVLKTADGKEIPVYNFEQFKKAVLERKEQSVTYVVNFWATWCKPCVAELPYFFELESAYKDKNVHFIYVSFDFMKSLETALVPFLDERKIESEVVVLDQKGINEWLPQIDSDWGGAIPATLIFNKEISIFIESNFESTEELEKELKPFL